MGHELGYGLVGSSVRLTIKVLAKGRLSSGDWIGEGCVSRFTQITDRNHFLAVVGLMVSCFLTDSVGERDTPESYDSKIESFCNVTQRSDSPSPLP